MERPNEEHTETTSITTDSSSVDVEPHFVTFLIGLCLMGLLFVRQIQSGVSIEQAIKIEGKQLIVGQLVVLGVMWSVILGWMAVMAGITFWRSRKQTKQY